ncbi:diguanylate cyclase/phosphodiesterase (GGDEF & EAL domains) with PAS/PAC sensor(s) [methanotrophic endosymbiont of Bathymodiolus azoricus (Menez Gwen)]|nr:diguanylate cyclase/phosphodiesterase (GGDEF & EAL domains) with PAS/PAC sensor(s) [methanotrophic endosymbiont of Bathymodiolus azoricus (Menez Gwen)]
MKDFQLDGCYQRVCDALQKHHIHGSLLELEITETMLAKNTEQCISLMSRLQKMDIKFSVDDFGTGYSSMSYLKKFPINTLKIDRAFVSECDVNKEDAAICRAIVALGKSLGLKIIAEGVETQSQLDFLKQTECDVYQGFLFSRPLPVDEIDALLIENIFRK